MAKKKPSKSYYKRKADRLFSTWIRNRDQICLANEARSETCGSPFNLQCAHIVTRSYSATRLDPDNAMALCRSCHVYFTHRPIEWRIFVNELLGEGYFERMEIRALSGVHRKVAVDWQTEAEHWANATS